MLVTQFAYQQSKYEISGIYFNFQLYDSGSRYYRWILIAGCARFAHMNQLVHQTRLPYIDFHEAHKSSPMQYYPRPTAGSNIRRLSALHHLGTIISLEHERQVEVLDRSEFARSIKKKSHTMSRGDNYTWLVQLVEYRIANKTKHIAKQADQNESTHEWKLCASTELVDELINPITSSTALNSSRISAWKLVDSVCCLCSLTSSDHQRSSVVVAVPHTPILFLCFSVF